jgi:hypothetical protein
MPDHADTVDLENIGIMNVDTLGKEKDKLGLILLLYLTQKLSL